MVLKYFCDRCGKELDRPKKDRFFDDFFGFDFDEAFSGKKKIHFCKNCRKEFEKFMKK